MQVQDSPEDAERMKILRRIISGETCVSEWESPDFFVLAISGLNEKSGYTGHSYKTYCFDLLWLKFHDVCYWLKNQPKAGGAIPLSRAGLDIKRIEALGIKRSCVQLFHKAELTLGMQKGSYLSKEEEKMILEKEKSLFAVFDLQKIKNSYGLYKQETFKPKLSISSDGKQRKRVLELDGEQCIFWGTDEDCQRHEKLEAGHIIPKATIKRLHLNQKLIKADYNLAAMCFRCNHKISDYLSKKHVDFYLKKFTESTHRNHKIVPYLRRIKDIQELD